VGRTQEKTLHGKKSSAAFSASAFKVSYHKFLEWGMKHRKEKVKNECFLKNLFSKNYQHVQD